MAIVFHEMKQTVRSGCSRGSSWASNHPIIIMIVPLFIIMLFIVIHTLRTYHGNINIISILHYNSKSFLHIDKL